MFRRVIMILAVLVTLFLTLSLSFSPTYAQEQFGSNWSGQYYNNTSFSGTPLTRIDAAINFNFGAGSPDPSIPADNFAARWTGTQAFHNGRNVHLYAES